MAKASQPSISTFAANSAGALGYFSLLMQWLWLAIVFLPGLLENGTFKAIFLSKPSIDQPIHSTTSTLTDSPVAMIGVVMITLIMIALTIYVVLKIPGAVAKSGRKITNEVTNVAVPIITHHKKVSAKKQRALTFAISFFVKFCLAAIAYLLLIIPPSGTVTLDGGIIWAIGSIFAASSFVWFGTQYAIAKLFALPPKQLL